MSNIIGVTFQVSKEELQHSAVDILVHHKRCALRSVSNLLLERDLFDEVPTYNPMIKEYEAKLVITKLSDYKQMLENVNELLKEVDPYLKERINSELTKLL